MLATVKHDIAEELSNESTFNEFFQNYIMDVQDRNIDMELAYMLRNNIVSVELVDRAVTDAFKGLME